MPQPRPPADSDAAERFQRMGVAYEALSLRRNEGKSIRRAFQGTVWGASVDGVAGTVRAPISRALPLACLCVEVARLGLASRALLL